MKLLLLSFSIALLVLVGGYLVYVRVAPDRPSEVHVDPMTTGGSSARSARVSPPEAPVFEATPEEVFAAADRFLSNLPRTSRIAEGPASWHATYATRTRVLGFPDDLSLRVVGSEVGTTLAVYARARLAGYDWGVNRARIDALLAYLGDKFGALP